MVFSLVHCVSWSFTFLSNIEELFWHMWIRMTQDCIFITTISLYPMCHLVLLVLPFTSLRSLPAEAYQTVQWTTFIPHVWYVLNMYSYSCFLSHWIVHVQLMVSKYANINGVRKDILSWGWKFKRWFASWGYRFHIRFHYIYNIDVVRTSALPPACTPQTLVTPAPSHHPCHVLGVFLHSAVPYNTTKQPIHDEETNVSLLCATIPRQTNKMKERKEQGKDETERHTGNTYNSVQHCPHPYTQGHPGNPHR